MSVLDLIWGIAILEAYGRRGGIVNTRPPPDQLEETMACTEKLRVLLQSLLGRTGSRLISINLENIAERLRGAKSGKRIERCGISTFQIAQSLATVASFAIGNTASGLENDREWSRGPNFDPYAVARTSALSPGKLRAVRPRSKLSPVVKSPLRRSTPIFRCSCRAELIGIK
jgi:hypothetical protein